MKLMYFYVFFNKTIALIELILYFKQLMILSQNILFVQLELIQKLYYFLSELT